MQRLRNWLKSLIAGSIISFNLIVLPAYVKLFIPVATEGQYGTEIGWIELDPWLGAFIVLATINTVLVHILKTPYQQGAAK